MDKKNNKTKLNHFDKNDLILLSKKMNFIKKILKSIKAIFTPIFYCLNILKNKRLFKISRFNFLILTTLLITLLIPLKIDDLFPPKTSLQEVKAAGITWDGSESSDWTVGDNWVGGVAPASGDDVIIDGVYTFAPTLDLTSGTTTINSLSLGATAASIFTLSNGSSTTNKLVVTGDVNIGASGTLTHTANTTAQTHTINLEAANLTITDGGTIDVNAKGYQSSTGPGEGANHGDYSGGAGYGGEGGDGYVDGGPTYGSMTVPTDIGSGGGTDSTGGGSGGGAVKLTVAGTTTVAGTIYANGGNGVNDDGGGSGGSVYITTGVLAGTGTVTASGGIGHSGAGGGGGGRIAIYYTTDSSTVSYQAYGGLTGASTVRMGGAGTIYTKESGTNGDLLIDNNDQDSLNDIYIGITPINETITLDTITIQNYGNLKTTASSNVTYTTLDWSTKGCITDSSGTFDLLSGGGAMMVPATSRLYAYTTRTYTSYTVNGYMEVRNAITTAGDFDIAATGTLTHEYNTTAQDYVIDITAANLTITDGGTIDVNAKGYQSSTGPGEGANHGDYSGGAGYGGEGGDGYVDGGPTYGSMTVPTDIGSGGGTDSTGGGSGGGAVKLTVAGTTTVAGTIYANGGNGVNDDGGGSGGSVYITTGVLAGTGTVTASGGIGHSGAGGGGGGRIAIYYTTDSSTVSYQAYGGLTGASTVRMGGAGTIYTKESGTNGDLLIDNNDQDSLNDIYIGITPINETITLDTITIQNYGNLKTTASSNVTYTTLDWSTKGCITDSSGTFDLLSGGGAMMVPATSRLYAYTTRTYTSYTVNGYMEVRNAITTAGDFDIAATGTLTHEYNTIAQDYVIDITAANFTIVSGGTINVNAKGYQSSTGPGEGADHGDSSGGAGYGGDGGNGDVAGGSAYGSITAPTDIGSGGGNGGGGGGKGGGAIKLTITGTTTVTGTIYANGGNGGYDSGGGSGGSIYITTGVLAGTGTIITNGGNSDASDSGGGGGGRIAILYTTDSSTVGYQAFGGLANASTLRMGGAGTIYKKSATQSNGDLTIDNNDQDNADDTYMGKTPLIDSDWTFDNIAISGAGKLDANGYNLIVYNNFSNSNGTFTHSDKTVTLIGTTTGNVIGGLNFYDLIINGAGGEWTTQDALSVVNNLTLTNGILSLSDQNLTVTGTFSNDSTLKLIGGSSQTISFTNDPDSGIVEYYGSESTNSFVAGNDYYNLTISGTGIYPRTSALNIDNNLVFNSGTFDCSYYAYYKEITIDHEEVDENLTNYPMLFSVIDANLKTTANEGQVTNANGYDIIFTDTDETPLSHEIEKYVASTGEFVSWVKIPSLSSTESTTIRIYYRNSSITTSQEDVTEVWSNDYLGAWHFNDNANDSTSNSYDGTLSSGVTYISGKVDSGIRTDANAEYINLPVIEVGSTYTLNYWSEFPINNIGSWRTLFQRQGGTYHHTIVQSDGQLGIYNSSFFSSGYDIDNLSAGWHYITTVASSGTTKFYIDGSTLAGTSNSVVTEEISRFGNHDSGQQWGSFDEVRISNTARTAGWISTTYNNQFSPSTFYNVSDPVAIPATGYTTIIGGDLINVAGSFDGSNTVIFTDNTQTSHIYGDTTFNNFTCATAGKTLQFEDTKTQTITGTLTFTGQEGNLVTLRSISDGAQWKINPTGTRSVSYVDVKDSNNIHATAIGPANSIDSGNTINWDFVSMDHFTITGNLTQTVGDSQTITITAVGDDGNTYTDHTGDHDLTFSGATSSGSNNPTCSDKDSADISFGTATPLTFTAGVATATMKLYTSELAEIEVDEGGAYSTTGDPAYDLNVIVSYPLANIPTSLSLTVDSTYQITATWSDNSNPAGTEYYIENTTKSTNSGWTTSTFWVSTALSCGKEYSFRVKARNNDGTETGFTSVISATTESCGGGSPPGSFKPPVKPKPSKENPKGEFHIFINNDDKQTTNRDITLTFLVGKDTTRMAISNSPNFENASLIPYEEEYNWHLSSCHKVKKTGEQSCTVYAKFYTQYGQSSKVVSDSIILKEDPPILDITVIQDHYEEGQSIIIAGVSERLPKITPSLDGIELSDIIPNRYGNWTLYLGQFFKGTYELLLSAISEAKIPITLTADILVVEVVPEEKPEEPPVEEPEEPEEPEDDPEDPTEPEEPEDPTEPEEPEDPEDPEDPTEPETPEDPTDPENPETPPVFEEDWDLIPPAQTGGFVFMPVPKETIKEIKELAEVFPELEEKLKEMEIEDIDDLKISDLRKLEEEGLILPNITKIVNLRNEEITPAIPFKELNKEEKEKIPEDIIFIKIGGGKIDIDINLKINSDGSLRKEVSTISGQTLSFFIKPKSKAEAIKGKLVFRSRIKDKENLSDSFLNLISKTASALEETKLVISEFEYSDTDNDGIYTTNIKVPSVEGEFDVLTEIDYEDQDLENKDLDLTIVSNPEGYIYRKDNNEETRIPDAKISLYQLNQKTNQYELFPASEYEQKNPIRTDMTGRYSFVIPQGTYYLEAQAQGYITYQTELFDAKEGSNINRAIELEKDNSIIETGIDRFSITSIIKNPIFILLLLLLFAIIIAIKKLFSRDRNEDDN